MVGLSKYGKDVPEEVKKLVEEEKTRIISGEWDVFDGPIKDQSGTIKVEAGQSLSDGDKLSMNWFVEGVKGDIPK